LVTRNSLLNDEYPLAIFGWERQVVFMTTLFTFMPYLCSFGVKVFLDSQMLLGYVSF
jgi:hypothetical protein